MTRLFSVYNIGVSMELDFKVRLKLNVNVHLTFYLNPVHCIDN